MGVGRKSAWLLGVRETKHVLVRTVAYVESMCAKFLLFDLDQTEYRRPNWWTFGMHIKLRPRCNGSQIKKKTNYSHSGKTMMNHCHNCGRFAFFSRRALSWWRWSTAHLHDATAYNNQFFHCFPTAAQHAPLVDFLDKLHIITGRISR